MKPTAFDPTVTPWAIRREMVPNGDIGAQLKYLVRCSILAPSTHNAQPWQFSITGAIIRLSADMTRWLPVADADQRELYLSLGCALENLLIAAEYLEFAPEVRYFPDPGDALCVAEIALKPGGVVSPHRLGLFDYIPLRATNFNRYDARPVGLETLDQLTRVCVESGVTPRLFTDHNTRTKIDDLVTRADAAQFSDPDFRTELAHWISQGAYSTSWLLNKLQAVSTALLDQGSRKAKDHLGLLMSSPVFGVITTQEDTHLAQMRSGQVYERMHLLASYLGLSMQPMNQVLQQASTKAALRKVLFPDHSKAAESQHTRALPPAPQMAFRLGYGAPVPEHTPRRPLEEVL